MKSVSFCCRSRLKFHNNMVYLGSEPFIVMTLSLLYVKMNYNWCYVDAA